MVVLRDGFKLDTNPVIIDDDMKLVAPIPEALQGHRFQVKATNSAGTATSPAFDIVPSPYTEGTEDYVIEPGQDAELRAFLGSIPQMTSFWWRDGVPFGPTSDLANPYWQRLVLPKVTALDEGVYECMSTLAGPGGDVTQKTASFRLRVRGKPQFTLPATLPEGVATQPYLFRAATRGVPDTITATGLPPGTSLTHTVGDLRIGGTPLVAGGPTSSAPAFKISITARNKYGTATASTTWVVNPPQPLPEIQIPEVLPDAAVTVLYTLPIPITNEPSSSSVAGLPKGLHYYPHLGKITGMPEAVSRTPAKVTFKATNYAGTATRTVLLNIRPPHPLPEIQVPEVLPDAAAGVWYLTQFSLTNEPTSFSVTGLPKGLILDGKVIYGFPEIVTSTPVKITLKATNYAGTATRVVSLNIRPCPHAGTYEGLILRDRRMDHDRMLGGRLTLTVTTTGAASSQHQGVTGIGKRLTGRLTSQGDGFTSIRLPAFAEGVRQNEVLELVIDESGLGGTLVVADTKTAPSKVARIQGVRTQPHTASSPSTTAGRYTARLNHHQPPPHWRQEGGVPFIGQQKRMPAAGNYPAEWGYIADNTPAVKSPLGIASATAHPGVRLGSFTWVDAEGLLHLYGGVGLWSPSITVTVVNEMTKGDHWTYDPRSQLWALQKWERPGSFPFLDTEEPSTKNSPGGRASGVTWVDKKGHVWLFGGFTQGAFAYGFFNDLWRYVPEAKTWECVRRPSYTSYGTQGVAAASNMPPERSDAAGWMDLHGHLWLFGGIAGATGGLVAYNDLWKFDTESRQWTWISGNQSSGGGANPNLPTSTHPGGRESASIWQDPQSGDVFLYGGWGPFKHPQQPAADIRMSDLWRWNHATRDWTRIHGLEKTAEAANPGPPPAYWSKTWRTPDGKCWLQTRVKPSIWVILHQTWQFDPATLKWTLEAETRDSTYEGYPEQEAVPGSPLVRFPDREGGPQWHTPSGQAWFYGGRDSTRFFSEQLYAYGPGKVPEAPGWLTLDVSAKGVITWTGMLGDGTTVTGSSGLGVEPLADGSLPWVFRYAPTGDFLSVQGMMKLNPADRALSGSLTAVENLRPAAQRDRTFRSGMPLHNVTVSGGSYQPLAKDAVPLGLPGGSGNASLSITLPDSTTPIQMPLTLGNAAASTSGALPAPFTKLSLKLTPVTGAFTGSAMLSTDDPAKPGKKIERAATVHGVLLDAEKTGSGLILVPDLPTTMIPATLAPIWPGTLRLGAAP